MSKNLFLMMREQEVSATNDYPNKKEIEFQAAKFAKQVLDGGEIEKTELIAQAVRMQKAVDTIVDEIKKTIDTDFEAYGLKVSQVSGGENLNYSDDPIYSELERKLKERKELLSLAYKSKDEIYDSEGIQVPKVSSTTRKGYTKIIF